MREEVLENYVKNRQIPYRSVRGPLKMLTNVVIHQFTYDLDLSLAKIWSNKICLICFIFILSILKNLCACELIKFYNVSVW